MLRFLPQATHPVLGLTRAERARIAAEPDLARAVGGILEMLPISWRRAGMINDVAQARGLPLFPVELISVPTLALYGTADPLVSLDHGRRVAAIPGARLVVIEGGSHGCVLTHAAEVRPVLQRFFAEHAPKQPGN